MRGNEISRSLLGDEACLRQEFFQCSNNQLLRAFVDIRHIVVGMFPLHVLKGELCTFSLDIFTSPSCYLAHGQREILQIPIHCLLLNQRGDPEDDDGTNDSCAKLT